MASITKKLAKRILPKLLKRRNKRNLTVDVVRKRNAHDGRLPENRIAKARAQLMAERQVAAKKVIAQLDAQRQVASQLQALAEEHVAKFLEHQPEVQTG